MNDETTPLTNPGPRPGGEDLHHGPVVETLEIDVDDRLVGDHRQGIGERRDAQVLELAGSQAVEASGAALHAVERLRRG